MSKSCAMKNTNRIYTAVFFTLTNFCFACSKKTVEPGTTPSQKRFYGERQSTGCDLFTGSPSDILTLMIFPADNAWNEDISASPTDPNSTQILNAYASAGLKADFGSGLWEGAPIGIPFVVVCGSQQKVPIVFRANSYDGVYGDESDPGPYPIPLTALFIEGKWIRRCTYLAVDKDW